MNRRTSLIFALAFLCCISHFNVCAADLREHTPVNNSSRVALKTNLLYDAVLVPNLGVEYNIYNNYTAYIDLLYAGLDMPSRHFYWNLYGTQLGLRKYFGAASNERNFTGHHLGLYGQILAYDLQAGNYGQQTPGLNIGVGIDYGYSFPVAPGMNIDLDLGFGYLAGKYYEYIAQDGHNTWRGTVRRAWIGPTRASVSLVWLIKPKNKKITKR